MFTKALRWAILPVAIAAMIVAASGQARADLYTLIDKNSQVSVNTGADGADGVRGVNAWSVNGVNQLHQQWFWFRIGDGTGEASIDTLPLLFAKASDTNSSPGDDVLNLTYGTRDGLEIDVKMSLQGTDSGLHSDLGEQLAIRHNSQSDMTIHFFQYSDFDLNGTSAGQSVILTPAGHPFRATQVGGGLAMNETVVTPSPEHWEASNFPLTRDKLDNITDLDTTLDGVTSAFGDATWAFEWDFVLAPGGSFLISKDKDISAVPAPGAVILGGLGLSLLVWMRRRVG